MKDTVTINFEDKELCLYIIEGLIKNPERYKRFLTDLKDHIITNKVATIKYERNKENDNNR